MDQNGTREIGVYIGADIGPGDDPAGMSEKLNNPLHLEIKIFSDPSELEHVRQEAGAFTIQIGMDEEEAARVVLALDEALTNIIRHAYEGANSKPIEIKLLTLESKLVIVIRDYGRIVHPSAIHSRDLEEVRPGGLGVHIMNECMDKVEFAPADKGVGTVLTMIKKI